MLHDAFTAFCSLLKQRELEPLKRSDFEAMVVPLIKDEFDVSLRNDLVVDGRQGVPQLTGITAIWWPPKWIKSPVCIYEACQTGREVLQRISGGIRLKLPKCAAGRLQCVEDSSWIRLIDKHFKINRRKKLNSTWKTSRKI
jgi:hypothetical protein